LVKRFALIFVAGAALATPSLASAGNSTVVKVDRASKLVAVTHANARVSLVHTSAAARLHVGQRIALQARTLKNGTLGSARVKVLGRAKTARFRGFVLARKHGRLVVSAGGAVISVRAKRTTSSAANGGPTPGTEVQVDAKVDDDDQLEIQKVTVVSESAPGGKLEGRLTIGTGTVTVRDDDMTLVLKVPTGFDLSKFKAGDEVLATFTQGADGSLTLTELAGDDDEDEADDEGEIEHHDGNHDDDDDDDGGDDD
jgi:hypothetical protein